MTVNKEYNKYAVIFIPTWSCNCICKHCFEDLKPETVKDDFWDVFYKRLKEMAKDLKIKDLVVYWQGGDIMTMNPKDVKKALDLGTKIFKDANCGLEHHCQTNLIGYNSQWADIITKYFGGRISSSLDYPNLYRQTPVIKKEQYNDYWITKKEEAEKDGLVVSVISLPNTESIKLGAKKFYNYFKNKAGIRNLQLNFSYPGANGKDPQPMDPKKLGDFLEDLYHLWIKSDRYMHLSPIETFEKIFVTGNQEGGVPCIWSYSCAKSLIAIGPDGAVGQCDCWVSTHHDYNFGNIYDKPIVDILASDKRKMFLDHPLKMIEDPECKECPYWKTCFGGCPIRAYSFYNDMYSKDYYCTVYKRIFSMILDQNRIHQ